MKKLNKYIIFFAAFAMAFASCAKEEVKPVEPETPGVFRVRFGAETSITKAVSTTDDEKFSSSWITAEDEIGITVYSNGSVKESNVYAMWDGDAFEAEFKGSYEPATTYQFKGVYPYSETGAVDFGNTRDQNYTAQNGKYDIMVSSAISATLPAENKLILPMNRQTATVYFHLKSGFNEEVKSVTLVTDEGKPIAAVSATLDTENGFVPTTGDNCNFITLNIRKDGSRVMHTTDMQFWFNVLPVEGTSLKLIVESESRTFTMNKKQANTTWEAGHLYTTVLEGIPADKWVEKAGAASTITITKDNSGIEDSYSNKTFTIEGITFGYNQWMKNEDNIQAKKSQSNSLYNTTAFPGRISKITFNQTNSARAISVKAGTSNDEVSTDITAPTTAATMTFDFSGGNYTYFSMSTPDNACYFSSIVIEFDTTFDPLNPNYSIKVPDGESANGTVAFKNAEDKSITYAKAGDLVKLTAVPNDGYALKEGTLVAKNSVTGDAISFEEGTTNFRMPAANVVVEAEFYKLPYHVTYDTNLPADQELGEGESVPSDSKDYTDDDNEVTVKSASLTCMDYNFVCWNTKADGTGTDYVEGDKFTITENTTLYAKWTDKLYTVTLEVPENGSYVIQDENENPLNDDSYTSFSVKNGTKLTYTYTANTDYKFKNWQVVDDATHTYTAAFTYTIDRSNITIKGNFEPKVYHKAYFSVEGTITNVEGDRYDEDGKIIFPENPTPSREGFIFIGWAKEAISGTQSYTPTTVNTTTEKMGKEDVTYYAVFAEGLVAVFDPADISSTPSTGTLTWTHTATGIALKLSSGQLYTVGSPKTFTVNSGTSNYFEISSSSVVSKITANISTSTYKIDKVSEGAELSTSSTTQTVTSLTLNAVKCYATSNNQIRLTKVKVESCSNYCTTIPAPRQLTGITISGDVTKKTYNEGEALDPTGLVVTANYDNGDRQEVTSSTVWSYSPATLSVGTTSCTVTATYEGKINTKDINNLTVNAAAVYTKVTRLDELTVDSKLIIVADAFDYAMSTTQNSSNRGQEDIVKKDNTISNPGENVQIFTAKAGKKAKTIAFYTGTGYIYAASSSSNHLKTEQTLSDNSSFTLQISDGKASLEAQGTNGVNVLRYNSINKMFSCYSSGQNDINIYKLNGSGSDTKIFADVAVTGVSLNKTATTISVGGTETLTATVAPDNASNRSITWASYESLVATVDGNGTVTAKSVGTATIRATSAADANKYAECVVTVTPAGGGSQQDYVYTFTSKSWADETYSWTSGKDGNAFTKGQGVQITSGATGANATSKSSFTKVSKIVVNYCTNAKAGEGTISVKVGNGEAKSYSVSAPSSGGTTLRNTDDFVFSTPESGKVNITVTCGTNSIYINSITITAD